MYTKNGMEILDSSMVEAVESMLDRLTPELRDISMKIHCTDHFQNDLFCNFH
jgi:hypothetical protein